MKYDRTLSHEAERFLSDGAGAALLAMLLDPGARVLSDGRRVPVDVQLRRGNEVSLYTGTARALCLRWNSQGFVAQPHQIYHSILMQAATAQGIANNWSNHRDAIPIQEGRYLANEGYWQSALAARYGRDYRQGDPWCVIDAQTLIEFTDRPTKDGALRQIQNGYDPIAQRLRGNPRLAGKLPRDLGRKALGDRLDLLAVTPDGDLAVVEIKHGANARGIYLSPLQVGFYVELLSRFRDEVVEGARQLMDQKVRLGLLPANAPRLKRAGGVQILPFVAVGDANSQSTCWRTLRATLDECLRGKPRLFADLKLAAFSDRPGPLAHRPPLTAAIQAQGLPWM